MYPTAAKPSVAVAVPGKIEGRKSGVIVWVGSPGWEKDGRIGYEKRGG
jgi:hypothetical protein